MCWRRARWRGKIRTNAKGEADDGVSGGADCGRRERERECSMLVSWLEGLVNTWIIRTGKVWYLAGLVAAQGGFSEWQEKRGPLIDYGWRYIRKIQQKHNDYGKYLCLPCSANNMTTEVVVDVEERLIA